MENKLAFGQIPAEELKISERELQRRLGMKPLSVAVIDRDSSPEGGAEFVPLAFPSGGGVPEGGAESVPLASPSGGGVPEGDGEGILFLVEKCRKQLLEAVECRFAWRRVPLTFPEEGTCLLGDIRIASRDLCRNLQDCTEAVLMGVTLGLGADRLLFRLEKTAPAEHFITDAVASAAVESLCDRVDRQIREEIGKEGDRTFRPRYSPGYGDCSIEVQRPLLDKLSAGTTLGITLNEVCFMTPVKSITAIMGIKE